tara:strand:+ start:319 stop:996 length:678 start_codon:yes stop_codon:yes gene_type:complete
MAKRVGAKARIFKPGKLLPPEGFHFMPDGSLMKNIDHKNEPENTVASLEEDALGRQDYKPSELESLSKLQYQFLTEKPYKSLTLRPYERTITEKDVKSLQQIRRVAVVRYTGEITEVDPEEYEQFKSNIAKGIYFILDFIWPTAERQGELDLKSRQLLRLDETIKQLPVELRQVGKDWLSESLSENPNSRKLKVNPSTYLTKLNNLKIPDDYLDDEKIDENITKS